MSFYKKSPIKILASGVLLGSLLLGATSSLVYANDDVPFASSDAVELWLAKQQIEYLRREYALATDLIGVNTPESIAKGRAIYHRIFTPDAKIKTVSGGEVGFEATGPEAWVQVAANALKVFDNTQHLIGTQLVTIEQLPNSDGKGGEARMSSYLQAWHDDPDRVLDIFIGTYRDKVRYSKEAGWQIYEMELEQVSGSVTDLQQ